MPHFGDLIVFLKEAESLIERKEGERLKAREREIGNIVSGFNAKSREKFFLATLIQPRWFTPPP